jgi:hypothetical protein
MAVLTPFSYHAGADSSLKRVSVLLNIAAFGEQPRRAAAFRSNPTIRRRNPLSTSKNFLGKTARILTMAEDTIPAANSRTRGLSSAEQFAVFLTSARASAWRGNGAAEIYCI